MNLSRISDRRRRRPFGPSLTSSSTRTETLSMRSRPLSRPRQTAPKKDPGGEAGVLSYASTTENLADEADRLQPVENLIGPEPLEPVQCLVEHRELVGIDAADLLHGAHVLLVQRVDGVAHVAALVGELDAHRAPVDARALVIEEAHLDEFLEIVGDVGAEIVAPRAQFAGGEFLVADIVQQQRLHRIDVGAAAAVEFVLDDVEETPVQALDESKRLQIVRPNVVEARLAVGGLDRLDDGFHVDAFPKLILFVVDGPCSRRMAEPYRSGSKISLNNRLKIGFIRFGGGAIKH